VSGQPFQPAPPAPLGGRGCLYSILVTLALVTVLVIVIVVVVNHEARKIASNGGNLGGPPPPAQYRVGDTGVSSGLAFTVYSFKYAFTAPLGSAPPSGQQYVEVDVQVQNLSRAGQVTFSSSVSFHLLDGANHQYDETTVPGVNPASPAGDLAAGQALRGYVIFEVPTGTTRLELRCQGTVTSAGAVFALI
jgi:Domain of unknown function (DUF4352)